MRTQLGNLSASDHRSILRNRTPKPPIFARRNMRAIAAAALSAAFSSTVFAQSTWTGAGDLTWSSPANWFGGVPGVSTDVTFTNAGSQTGPPTSIVDQLFTINSLAFNNTSGNDQFVSLDPGTSLNITGSLSLTSGGNATFGGGAPVNVTAGSAIIDNGNIALNPTATLNVTQALTIGYADQNSPASGALILSPGAGLNIGTAAQPASLTIAQDNLAGDGNGGNSTATFAPDSSQNPNMSLYLSSLNIATGWTATGTVDLTKYTGPLSIGSLNIGAGQLGVGHFIFGNAVNNQLTFGGLTISNGDITVNPAGTLNVTQGLTIGYAYQNRSDSGALILSPGAGLNIGTAAQPASLTIAQDNLAGDGNGGNSTATFAPDSSQNPNMSLYLSSLNIATGWTATGTVDLTKYTGPLSIGSLNIGAGQLGVGHFIFGNAVNNQLTFGGLTISNGDITVNPAGTLNVTQGLTIGYAYQNRSDSGALILSPGAGLNIGTAAQPASLTIAQDNLAGDGNGGNSTATFAPDSSQNPNMSLYLSSLNIATGWTATGTVDLTKYTGPLSIGSLNIGAGQLGVGHFIFGNAVNNQLTFGGLTISNGDITVNPAGTLNVTQGLTIGYAYQNRSDSGALILSPGAGLNIGTAAQPASLTIAQDNLAGDGNGGNSTATFAPDSSQNPNMSLYLSSLNIATGWTATGTVDLTKYTGPLSIGSLNIGAGQLGVGHFIFGNAVNNQLTFGGLTISNGDITVNPAGTLNVTQGLTIGYAYQNRSDSGALILSPGAGLNIGTAAQPASLTIAQDNLAGDGNGGNSTATFAPDSSQNPNMSLYLSSLNIATGWTATGTVDLTKYTGPLSIGSLNIGAGQLGVGHFIFGNAVNNQLTFGGLTISNGDITVNPAGTLNVTQGLTIGYAYQNRSDSGALILSPGAGLNIGTAAQPASLTIAQDNLAGDGNGGNSTATFAPDSSQNPNMSLYLSSLNIATGWTATGTVDLTKYTGPLSSIGTVNIGSNHRGMGLLTFGNAVNSTLRITGGMTVGSGGRFILNPNSAIDLTNTYMTINYGSGPDPISTIAAYLISGYNHGSWNGPGINSSAAATNNSIPGNSLYGLGYADSADPGNPAGLPANTIEVMYTLLGDANLDGKVNGTDFNLLAANFNQSGRSWDEGDFNYDGNVNGTDFVLMAANFNQFASQSAVSAADWTALQDFAAANGISLANVPEPASAGLIAMTGLGILCRRRRSSRSNPLFS